MRAKDRTGETEKKIVEQLVGALRAGRVMRGNTVTMRRKCGGKNCRGRSRRRSYGTPRWRHSASTPRARATRQQPSLARSSPASVPSPVPRSLPPWQASCSRSSCRKAIRSPSSATWPSTTSPPLAAPSFPTRHRPITPRGRRIRTQFDFPPPFFVYYMHGHRCLKTPGASVLIASSACGKSTRSQRGARCFLARSPSPTRQARGGRYKGQGKGTREREQGNKGQGNKGQGNKGQGNKGQGKQGNKGKGQGKGKQGKQPYVGISVGGQNPGSGGRPPRPCLPVPGTADRRRG